jgi:hypothetical protein
MTYGRGHLLMPRPVARARVMAALLGIDLLWHNREAAVMSSLAIDFEGHTVR